MRIPIIREAFKLRLSLMMTLNNEHPFQTTVKTSSSSPYLEFTIFLETGAALAFIGEKSRGISSSRGIFNSLQSREKFSPFLLISWDSVNLSRPHPLHEKFSPSRGIYRLKLLIEIIFPLYFEEIKFLLGSRHFHIPREFLPISPHLVGFIKICPDPTPSTRSSPYLVGFTD